MQGPPPGQREQRTIPSSVVCASRRMIDNDHPYIPYGTYSVLYLLYNPWPIVPSDMGACYQSQHK